MSVGGLKVLGDRTSFDTYIAGTDDIGRVVGISRMDEPSILLFPRLESAVGLMTPCELCA